MLADKVIFSFDSLAAATCGRWAVPPAAGLGGVASVFTDTREKRPGGLFVALRGEKFDGHEFLAAAVAAGAVAVCVQPGTAVPAGVAALEVADTLAAYQSLARERRRHLKGLTVIGLTGSSGKTSAKEILGSILSHGFGKDAVLVTEANTNNHVGVPKNLLDLEEHHRFAVIEMGTNHFGEIDVLSSIAEPDIALVVSIGPAHLESFGDTDGVAREKSAIFNHVNPVPFGRAVVPLAGPGASVLRAAAAELKPMTFGADRQADIQFDYLCGSLRGSSFELAWKKTGEIQMVRSTLKGAHQVSNAAAAAAVATILGMDAETIAAGLEVCELSGMRSRVRDVDGVTWVNDAYNANPASVKAGLAWMADFAHLHRRCFVILGDMLELGPNGPAEHAGVLAFCAAKLPTARLVTVGPIMATVAGPEAEVYPDSATAAAALRGRFQPGDLVYLKGSRGTALEKIELAVAGAAPEAGH